MSEVVMTETKNKRTISPFSETCIVKGCTRKATHHFWNKDANYRARHEISISLCDEHWEGAMALKCMEYPFGKLARQWKNEILKAEALARIYRYKEYVSIVDTLTNEVVEMLPYDDYDPKTWFEGNDDEEESA